MVSLPAYLYFFVYINEEDKLYFTASEIASHQRHRFGKAFQNAFLILKTAKDNSCLRVKRSQNVRLAPPPSAPPPSHHPASIGAQIQSLSVPRGEPYGGGRAFAGGKEQRGCYGNGEIFLVPSGNGKRRQARNSSALREPARFGLLGSVREVVETG